MAHPNAIPTPATQVMTADFRAKKNMDASNTYAVLTVITTLLLVFPAVILEGSAAKAGFDAVEDKSTFLKVGRPAPPHARLFSSGCTGLIFRVYRPISSLRGLLTPRLATCTRALHSTR